MLAETSYFINGSTADLISLVDLAMPDSWAPPYSWGLHWIITKFVCDLHTKQEHFCGLPFPLSKH